MYSKQKYAFLFIGIETSVIRRVFTEELLDNGFGIYTLN